MAEQMMEWKCRECGFLFEGHQHPGECPECGGSDPWEGSEAIRQWKCRMCDFVFSGTDSPASCPSCGCEAKWEET
jgi:rubrerythrin